MSLTQKVKRFFVDEEYVYTDRICALAATVLFVATLVYLLGG